MLFSKYILRRLLQAIPLVFIIIIINFFLIHAAPGDPVEVLTGQMAVDTQYLESLRREFGLDQPLYVQLATYVGKVISLDLGYSLRYRQDIFDLILSRMPATLLLMGSGLFISSVGGILIGVIAASRPYGFTDNAMTLFALAGYSMPVFWLAHLLLLAFALQFPLFPPQGMVSLRAASEGWERVVDVLHHLALPALTYSVYHITLIYRITRVQMQDVLAQDFITTARAKGVPENRVLYIHALRNAMLPVVTVIGVSAAFMFAGSVLTETVFAWPGMGRLMFEAIMARDYPLLLGLFTTFSFMVIVVNVIIDVIYAIIDPRVVYK